MKSKIKQTSVARRWWLIISTTIFLLLASATLGLVALQLNYYQHQERTITEEFTQNFADQLAIFETPLQTANVVAIMNQKNSYQKSTEGIFQKKIETDDRQVNIQVFNVDKEEVFRTKDWNDYTTFESNLKTSTRTLRNGAEVIQTTTPILSANSRLLIGYVAVTNRLEDYNDMRREFRMIYLWWIVVELAVSVVLGYLIAQQISKPIRKIQEIISSISEENIATQRLTVENKQDEFAIVSTHFNELLDKISFYIDQQKHFVEDVSHELRTPVAIVEGHLKLLNRWGKDDPQILEESLQSSLLELKRMKTLVQEMLDLSRAPQVKEQNKDATTNVTDVLHQIVRNFQVLYPDFSFRLDDDIQHALNVPIYHNHFEQVVIILMDNAVKYSLDRKEIIVSLSKGEEHVEVAVQDFGMGMSEEDKKKVFSRFYRVDKARSRERGGNGLGLSIAKELVESYGGEITLTTALDHGSIFNIILPLKDE